MSLGQTGSLTLGTRDERLVTRNCLVGETLSCIWSTSLDRREWQLLVEAHLATIEAHLAMKTCHGRRPWVKPLF